jgi:hypothetical protein
VTVASAKGAAIDGFGVGVAADGDLVRETVGDETAEGATVGVGAAAIVVAKHVMNANALRRWRYPGIEWVAAKRERTGAQGPMVSLRPDHNIT